MQNILFSFIVFPMSIAFGQPIKEQVVIPEPIHLTQSEVIQKYSNIYAVSAETLTKVMMCESNLDNSKIGDNGLAIGIAQFHQPTFDNFSKQLGEDLDIKNEEHQIKLMAYAFSKGDANHWTAYRALKNGGTYTFYSKKLGKWFTVICK